jgi:biofilm PGA synthesis N-glycosyltransferase PgaC
LFFNHKGFAGHSHMVSGDDDLFINEAATGRNTSIELRPESHTRSEAKYSWKDWYLQKKRHLTTGPHYKTFTKFLLGTENMTRILFYAGFIFLLAKTVWPIVILALFIFRLITMLSFFKIISRRLNEKHLLLPSPILDFLLPFLNIFILFFNYVEARRSRWK